MSIRSTYSSHNNYHHKYYYNVNIDTKYNAGYLQFLSVKIEEQKMKIRYAALSISIS